MADKTSASKRRIAVNRRALRDYHVLEKFTAGIALQGTEVKSLRAGQVNLTGAFARVEHDEAILHGLSIPPYEFGNQFNHEPDRPRRLLLHKREIYRLKSAAEQKGHALVPLSLFFERGRVKVELGVCKGKREFDKRETVKRRTADREAERAIRRH